MMKKTRKVISLLLMVFALYTGCRKQEAGIDQNNVDIAVKSIYSPIEVSEPDLDEEKTIEEIIENYGYSSDLDRTQRGALAFQIEGNFTGSGTREIVAFYYRYSSGNGYNYLTSAICFVLDTNEEKVEKIFTIKWGSIVDKQDEMETIPGISGDMGRQIIWEDIKIGYVGDFNGNGKEELYLLSKTGMNRQPYFFEFDKTGFIQLLDFGIVDAAYIESIDIERKIISLRITGETIMEKRSYIWDNDTRRYELLTTETKRYRWNNAARQYEEIVE